MINDICWHYWWLLSHRIMDPDNFFSRSQRTFKIQRHLATTHPSCPKLEDPLAELALHSCTGESCKVPSLLEKKRRLAPFKGANINWVSGDIPLFKKVHKTWKNFYRNPTSIHSLNPRSQAFLSPFSERKDFLVPNACETRWKNTTIPLHVPIPSSGARCDALHFFVSKLARQHRKIHAIAATAADPKFDRFFQRSRCKLNTHKLVFLWHLTQPYVCPPRRQHKNLWKKKCWQTLDLKAHVSLFNLFAEQRWYFKKIIQWLDADETIIF